jgi:hypothetical protein
MITPGWKGRAAEAPPGTEDLAGWLAGRLPDDWFVEPPTLRVDRDEILLVGRLAPPETSEPAACEGRIGRFRESTREQRMEIAREVERRYRRTLSWAASCGEAEQLFTTLSVPVMTRLRLPERAVLDTLVDSGVARSRSDALAWCVRLVAEHSDSWLAELREALRRVEEVRRTGPAG